MTNRSSEEIQADHKEIARQGLYGTANEVVDGLLDGISDPTFRADVEESLDYQLDAVDVAEARRRLADAAATANNRRRRKLSPAGIAALGASSNLQGGHHEAPIAPTQQIETKD